MSFYKRQRQHKPIGEMSVTERLADAHAAIGRLTASLEQGDNRFGSYGDNLRDSIRRWRETIKQLESVNPLPTIPNETTNT